VTRWTTNPLRIAEANDILLSVRAPVGPTNLAAERCCIGRGLAAIRADTPLNQKYLFYYFRNIASWLAQQGTGSTFAGINSHFIHELEVPVAPLNEQKQIVEKLDTLLARVDACQARLDRVARLLNHLRQAVLAVATSGQLTENLRIDKAFLSETDWNSFDFSDAECLGNYRFPSNWETRRLGDIAEITTGIAKSSRKQDPSYEEVPYLRVANVQRGFLDLKEIQTIRVPQERIEQLILEPGDILFNEGGDLDKLGRGWVWSGEIGKCIFQNHVFRARLSDTDFSPKFFSNYGNSRGVNYFLTYGKQTTNLASISKSVLAALPVVVPPADEQHEIVRRIEVLFALADGIEARCQAARTQVEHLTPVVLSKAFHGELVPQDPDEEPASVLLERIRAQRAAKPEKPKKVVTRKPKRTKMTEEFVKDAIRQLPEDKFSFDDLRSVIAGDYEQLKTILFALLSETEPSISQVFDESAKVVRFIRSIK